VHLRLFQQEVLQQADLEDTIAFLPTGSGKTEISIQSIQSHLRLQRAQPLAKRKFIAFVAPTNSLVEQQKECICASRLTMKIILKTFTGRNLNRSQTALIEHWQKMTGRKS
jgi:ERCC4-related helicase